MTPITDEYLHAWAGLTRAVYLIGAAAAAVWLW